MNEELRQRIIDSIAADDRLSTTEQEVNFRFAQNQNEMSVFSAVKSVSKHLIAHPEFEIEILRQKTADGYESIRDNFEDEFDGRRKTVSVQGKMPLGVLKVRRASRSKNIASDVVSDGASDLRMEEE